MGTKPGVVQIEEAGLPVVSVKVSVSVWAASNPDEDPGPLEEIRRQLSDRFDMVCYMGRPTSIDVLAKMLKDNFHGTKAENHAEITVDYQKQHEMYTQIMLRWAERYLSPTFLILPETISPGSISNITWRALGLSRPCNRVLYFTASLKIEIKPQSMISTISCR